MKDRALVLDRAWAQEINYVQCYTSITNSLNWEDKFWTEFPLLRHVPTRMIPAGTGKHSYTRQKSQPKSSMYRQKYIYIYITETTMTCLHFSLAVGCTLFWFYSKLKRSTQIWLANRTLRTGWPSTTTLRVPVSPSHFFCFVVGNTAKHVASCGRHLAGLRCLDAILSHGC